MTVKLRELKDAGARYGEKRRGRRMNSRVPIRLEWEGEAAKRETIDAITRTVNPYGCLVFLTEPLEVEQRLALTNLATQTSNAAIVVWKGNQQPEGWEYGIELVSPDMEFWGIEL
ncbi:MAG TPA: hypothetical protein VK728_15940 [Candidatus Sulfotelmatobacter sp.]|jgi:hypothetical protein|nr:hypothetical protein [Candidatus Sulfotelmatobacter sp.]